MTPTQEASFYHGRMHVLTFLKIWLHCRFCDETFAKFLSSKFFLHLLITFEKSLRKRTDKYMGK